MCARGGHAVLLVPRPRAGNGGGGGTVWVPVLCGAPAEAEQVRGFGGLGRWSVMPGGEYRMPSFYTAQVVELMLQQAAGWGLSWFTTFHYMALPGHF